MLSRRRFPSIVLATLTLLLPLATLGCGISEGPRTLPKARFDYSQAVARSWSEQLLLNLVRLRYRDAPQFLELESVVAQYSRQGSASLSPLLIDGGDSELSLGLGVEAYERPTLTFQPLEGEAFVRRLLRPLEPTELILMAESGWSVTRLFQCCVQEIYRPGRPPIRNALRAAGPTPEVLRDGEWRDFRRLSELLRQLQVSGGLRAQYRIGRGEEATPEVQFHIEVVPGLEDVSREAREILGLSGEVSSYRLVDPGPGQGDDELAFAGRSLLGVLFYLSQGVEAPPGHVEEGLVTVMRGQDGEALDWNRVSGGLLQVHTSPRPVADAAVQVPYRGHWFYIADSDLHSKSSFLLVTQLLSLQSSTEGGNTPNLTISAGG